MFHVCLVSQARITTYHGKIKLQLYEVVAELKLEFSAIPVQRGIAKLVHLHIPLEDIVINRVGLNTFNIII